MRSAGIDRRRRRESSPRSSDGSNGGSSNGEGRRPERDRFCPNQEVKRRRVDGNSGVEGGRGVGGGRRVGVVGVVATFRRRMLLLMMRGREGEAGGGRSPGG